MRIKKILFSVSFMAFAFAGFAQDIILPQPHKSGGLPLGEALALRKSVRSFDSKRDIPVQILSNLLWSASGINRPDGKRTNPTALNKQEIDLFVFSSEGVYYYDYKNNILRKEVTGDHRGLIAGSQTFVKDAPVSILIVADIGRFGKESGHGKLMGAVDAGIVCQNINLFCGANCLATVPRASMDAEGIVKLLKLRPEQLPLMNNPVGYEAR